MPKPTDDMDLESLVQGSIVSMEILLLHEIRDCDLASGTPMYPNKVNVLRKTIESYQRIRTDKKYWAEVEKTRSIIENPKDLKYNMREPKHRHRKVEFIEEIDYDKLDTIIRKYLAHYGLTFRIERKDKI